MKFVRFVNMWLLSDHLPVSKGLNRIAQVTGSFISSVREACKNGLLDWSPRLMLAMYTCDIQSSSAGIFLSSRRFTDGIPRFLAADVLGKVYGVVAKRRGRIMAEEMKEGTSFFNVSARLPVVESFGFADGMFHLPKLLVQLSYYHYVVETFASVHRAQPVHSLSLVGEFFFLRYQF
jgi:hypothetical protein